MSFDRLLAHDRLRILLVNLAETERLALLPDDVRKTTLRAIEGGLATLPPTPPEPAALKVFADVVYPQSTRLQAQGTERPAEDLILSAVVSFDKIRVMLEKVVLRRPGLKAVVDAIVAPDAPDATVAEAVSIINAHMPRLGTVSLSGYRDIFWAAPDQEIDRLLARCGPGASPMQVARHLRDALGLVHLDFDITHPNRHLFLFRARGTIAEIIRDEDMVVTRPTTLDGWENRRFCQKHMPPAPFCGGCGMTVDIADFGVAAGAAELVCSAIPLRHFEAAYLGPVDRSAFGPDADYLEFIRGGNDLASLAAYLQAAAA